MQFITKSGEVTPIIVNYKGTVIENCTLTVRDGQTFGEALSLSGCTCELCDNVRNEVISEHRDSSTVPLTEKIPLCSEV